MASEKTRAVVIRLVEFSETSDLFTNPKEELTEAYLTGRQG